MKELTELKNEFYEVMYKYEKSFSEEGVMANLTAWQTAKADLLSLLRRHPDWNEDEQAIIFDCNQALSIQSDMVDETAFTLLDITSEILSVEQLEDFRAALHAAVSGYSRTVSEENLEILRQRGGIRCTSDQKASRIIGKLCRKFGVDSHDRYNAVFAQLADALNPLTMQETGVLSVHPCDFLEMSSKSNTWMSCHRLNGGGYQAGCLSYMSDSVSMVFYAVDADVHGEYRKAIRRYRPDVLLQGWYTLSVPALSCRYGKRPGSVQAVPASGAESHFALSDGAEPLVSEDKAFGLRCPLLDSPG